MKTLNETEIKIVAGGNGEQAKVLIGGMAAGGAIAGTAVAGPVGAAVGGVVGAVAGAAVYVVGSIMRLFG
jgi:hypothetical protein